MPKIWDDSNFDPCPDCSLPPRLVSTYLPVDEDDLSNLELEDKPKGCFEIECRDCGDSWVEYE